MPDAALPVAGHEQNTLGILCFQEKMSLDAAFALAHYIRGAIRRKSGQFFLAWQDYEDASRYAGKAGETCFKRKIQGTVNEMKYEVNKMVTTGDVIPVRRALQDYFVSRHSCDAVSEVVRL